MLPSFVMLRLTFQKYLCPLQILRGVDADGLDIGEAYADAVAVLEPAELFEALGLFKAALWKLSDLGEHVAAVGIDAKMLEEWILTEPVGALDTSYIWYDTAAEVKSKTTHVGDDLRRVGILYGLEALERFAQGTDLRLGGIEEVHEGLYL